MPNFCINFLNKAAKLLSISYDFAVAPSSDAWIKTVFCLFFQHIPLSHPPRMRGLKLCYNVITKVKEVVAPSSDAWIKTYYKGRDNIPLYAGQATVQSVPYTTN